MPEWLQVVSVAGGLLGTLAGALGGAWIGGRSTRDAARIGAEGQLRADAIRERRNYRREETEPYVQAALLLTEFVPLVFNTMNSAPAEMVTAVRGALARDPRFGGLAISYKAIPHDAFRRAFEEVLRASNSLANATSPLDLVPIIESARDALGALLAARVSYLNGD